jgi:hypothetical protein
MTFDPHVIRAQAEKFSENVFRDNVRAFVAQEWERFESKRPDAS